MAWCWKSDAIEKRERRPKSQILINRTPGEIECGVQNHLVLGTGRRLKVQVASRVSEINRPDAA